MRIVQVASTMAEPAAGTTYFIQRLCENLARDGHDVRLLSVGDKQTLAGINHIALRQQFASVPLVNKLGISRQLKRALAAAAGQADIIHAHGLWRMANVYPAQAAAGRDMPSILSPHGMLAPLALEYSPRMKRLFWRALQGPAFHRATCVHATSEQEFRDLRRAGARQPIAVIPIGVDVPQEQERQRGAARTLLYLGRLHPIKGLDVLLRAWQRVAKLAPDWRLRIVGPEELGYGAALQREARELDIPRVEFLGPRFAEEKSAEYRNAQIYVLPSRTENFGMTVVEALAHGTPVIATTGTPWAGIRDRQCGWFVEQTVDAMEAVLREALALDPETLASMGRAGRDWMARDFAWEQIGQKMEACYRWMSSGGAVPDFVRLD